MKKFANDASTLLMISSIYQSLSKAEQKVAGTVTNNAETTTYPSITDLAESSGVGETTVIRFCRKLGFHGFQEFKLAIAQDLVSPSQQVYGKIEESDDIQKTMQTFLEILFRGQILRGMSHLPQGVDQPNSTVVLFHGFTGNRVEGHRLFYYLSKALEEVGVASVRMDFLGSGESDGDYADMTLPYLVEQAEHIVSWTHPHCKQVRYP